MNGNETAPPPAQAEPPLEFKPVVRGIAYALLAAAVLGSGYVTFHLGYEQGYAEAAASEKVSQALNSAAVRNLTCFMQSSTASDEELEAMVKDPDAALAWIKDEQIRREAEWLLAQSLLQRGRTEHAGRLLAALFRSAPRDSVWARRAMGVGDAMCAAGTPEPAQAFYRYASGIFAAEQSRAEQAGALSRLAAAGIAGSRNCDGLMQQLESLLQEAAPLGHAADSLRSCVLVYLGGCHKAMGDEASATRCFEEALRVAEGVDEAQMSPAMRVCCGAAHLVKGNADKAERLLREGEGALGHTPADMLCRVLALRNLAVLAEQRGEHLEALALLNRTEGVAETAVPRTDLFWPCFYDQRGWIQFLAGGFEAAHHDFSRVLASTGEPALRVQSLEGAGRCCLMLEQPEAAVRLFTECLNLRTANFAQDRDSLARLWILLAQAYEPQNKPEQVAAAYGQALSRLQPQEENYRTAAFGHAKALGEAGLWQESLDAWEALLPHVKTDPEDYQEVQEGLAACRDKLNIPAAPAAAPAVQRTPTRARSRRAASRRNHH